MTEAEFLLLMTGSLEAERIPYMVVGSRGGSFHGLTRTTQDVDLVIDPALERLEAFLARFDDRFYWSQAAAREALARRGQFNIIHLSSGWKADLIVRKQREFSRSEFDRRQTQRLFDAPMFVATPEDLILSKLEWDRLTPSERQRTDAMNIAVVNWRNLDRAYLTRWASSLGIDDSLAELLAKVERQKAEG